MSKCTYLPVIRPRVAAYYDLHSTRKVLFPWYGDTGSLDGQNKNDFVPATGYAAIGIVFQAYGILPGDTFLWQYSLDGITWFDMDAGPEDYSGMDKTASYLAFSESSLASRREPLTDGSIWLKLTVSRPGCVDLETSDEFTWQRTGSNLTAHQSSEWEIRSGVDTTLFARVNGVDRNVTYHYNMAPYASYSLDVDEVSLIPALPEVAYTLTLDCLEAQDEALFDVFDMVDPSYRPFLLHYYFHWNGTSLVSIQGLWGASDTVRLVANAGSGVTQVSLTLYDVWNRSFTAVLTVKLECVADDVVMDEVCGPCSMQADFRSYLLPYYWDAKETGVYVPWEGSGQVIDGEAAADWMPQIGNVAVMLLLQAVNVLEGDTFYWEISADGLVWSDAATQGYTSNLHYLSTAQSSDPLTQVPLESDWSMYFRLTVNRNNCDEVVITRKLVLLGSFAAPGDSEAVQWSLQDGNGNELCRVVGRTRQRVQTDVPGFVEQTSYLECEDCTQDEGEGGENTNSGVTQGEIENLLSDVKECVDNAILCLGLDPELFEV